VQKFDFENISSKYPGKGREGEEKNRQIKNFDKKYDICHSITGKTVKFCFHTFENFKKLQIYGQYVGLLFLKSLNGESV